MTDHSALKWLFTTKHIRSKYARWIIMIQEFDFTIEHRAGDKHQNADALSRRPIAGNDIFRVAKTRKRVKSALEIAQRNDDFCKTVFKYLEKNVLPSNQTEARVIILLSRFMWVDDDGVLKHIWQPQIKRAVKNVEQIVVPQEKILEVLKRFHDDTGHVGFTRTFNALRERYFWPNYYAITKKYVSSCNLCQSKKIMRGKKQGVLMPTLPAQVGTPFKRLAVDVMGPLTVTFSGNNSIVVFTDYFTKWPEAFACFNPTAEQIAKMLFDRIITRFGYPEEIMSDRGSEFMGNLMTGLFKIFKIRKLSTAAYHPQTDGQVERLNHTIAEMLGIFCNKLHQKDWDEYLPQCLEAYRTTPHATTGETPFMSMFGRRVRKPVSFDEDISTPMTVQAYKKELLETMSESHELARQTMLKKQLQAKQYYDKKHRAVTFQVGERVRVWQKVPTPGLTKKLQHRWLGPYVITKVINPNSYEVNFGKEIDDKRVINVERLKRHNKRSEIGLDKPWNRRLEQNKKFTEKREKHVVGTRDKNTTTSRAKPDERLKSIPTALATPFELEPKAKKAHFGWSESTGEKLEDRWKRSEKDEVEEPEDEDDWTDRQTVELQDELDTRQTYKPQEYVGKQPERRKRHANRRRMKSETFKQQFKRILQSVLATLANNPQAKPAALKASIRAAIDATIGITSYEKKLFKVFTFGRLRTGSFTGIPSIHKYRRSNGLHPADIEARRRRGNGAKKAFWSRGREGRPALSRLTGCKTGCHTSPISSNHLQPEVDQGRPWPCKSSNWRAPCSLSSIHLRHRARHRCSDCPRAPMPPHSSAAVVNALRN